MLSLFGSDGGTARSAAKLQHRIRYSYVNARALRAPGDFVEQPDQWLVELVFGLDRAGSKHLVHLRSRVGIAQKALFIAHVGVFLPQRRHPWLKRRGLM